MQFFDAAPRPLPSGVSLPEKDEPILLAAMEAQAAHLLTGDIRHFGPHFGKAIEGILIMTPARYLKTHRSP